MKRRRHAPGTPPGTLVAVEGHQTAVDIVAYGPATHLEESAVSIERVRELKDTHPVLWVNVVGLTDLRLFRDLEELFRLHPLALEDTFNLTQRPKVDTYEHHHYFAVRLPAADGDHESEQISIYLGRGFVVTVQERPGDLFDPIRERIRIGRPRLREGAAEYLTYALLDVVVDSFAPKLERIREQLNAIEDEIVRDPSERNASRIHDLKRELVRLQRQAAPLRELLLVTLRHDHGAFNPGMRVYLQDCLDHATQALDLINSYREVAVGLMDLSLSLMSQRMNEIMKVLTIIATVFIPLSFICGLYGMNFDPAASRWNMPELAWPLGYPMALAAMAAVAGGFLVYFRRKGWL